MGHYGKALQKTLPVLLTKTAQKDLSHIPKDRRSQVLQALRALESWPLLEGMDISFAPEKVNREPVECGGLPQTQATNDLI